MGGGEGGEESIQSERGRLRTSRMVVYIKKLGIYSIIF